MKLAFNGQAHYTDFSQGYELYKNRSKLGNSVDYKTYKKIIRRYCGLLSERLLDTGIVDLPCELGSIAAATITRRPQYRGKKFIGYGKIDWDKGHYDGKLKTFGLVFLPTHNKNQNLRSFGYVANRNLFKRVKSKCIDTDCSWVPLEFNKEMI